MPTKESVAQHTPGPWQHAPLSDAIITARGVAVAEPPDGYDEEQWRADAQLIAAAPALLASVREFVALYDGLRDSIGASVTAKLERAEATIQKAEGRHV